MCPVADDSDRTRRLARATSKPVARQHGRWSSRTTARSLEEHFPEEAVSDRTVRRILHRRLDFKFGKLWRKFKLTEIHKLNRVMWSLLHTEDGWERTIFLDESCFALTKNGGVGGERSSWTSRALLSPRTVCAAGIPAAIKP